MGKLLGFILLIGGLVMLYLGWQAHLSSLDTAGGAGQSSQSESVSLLTVGAVAVVWGLAISLRRRV